MAPTKITLRNFKSIGEEAQTIELAPYTLLFGPNSAGKSTLIQSLVYVHELLTKGTRDVHKTELGGEAIDLGGFANTVHGKDTSRDIQICIEVPIDYEWLREFHWFGEEYSWRTEVPWRLFVFSDSPPNSVSVELVIGQKKNGSIFVKRVSNSVGGDEVIRIDASSDGRQVIAFQPLVRLAFGGDENSFLFGDLNLWQNWSYQFEDDEGQSTVSGEIEEQLSALESAIEDSRDELTEPWTLDIGDALPFQDGSGAFKISGGDDWLDDYYREDPDLPGTGLNYCKVLEAMCAVPLEIVLRQIQHMIYVGPLRSVPTRMQLRGTEHMSGGWWNGAAAWGQASHSHLAGEADWVVNVWMGARRLDTGYGVKTKYIREVPDDHPIWQFSSDDLDDDRFDQLKGNLESLPTRRARFLEHSVTGMELSAKDVGTGISQLFPVLAAAAHTHAEFICVEQPELHVHPKLQTHLADVFIDSYLLRRNSFVLETHSEHLLLRFLRRVKQSKQETKLSETENDAARPDFYDRDSLNEYFTNDDAKSKRKVSPNDLAVYYVEHHIDGSRFTKLAVNSDGDFDDDWPEGFFNERETELFGG